jgi:hypothetical protein
VSEASFFKKEQSKKSKKEKSQEMPKIKRPSGATTPEIKKLPLGGLKRAASDLFLATKSEFEKHSLRYGSRIRKRVPANDASTPSPSITKQHNKKGA